MSSPRHAALVRGDDNGLAVRRFATPEAASDAAQARELARPAAMVRSKRSEWKLSRAAKELGICARTLKRALSGGFIRTRQPSPNVTYIPGDEVNLLKIHGIHGLRRLRLRQGQG
jgi:hypothetical protein